MCTSNVCDCAIFRLSEKRQCPPTGPFVFICKYVCIMGGELQGGEVRQGDRPDCCEGQKELGAERGLLEPGSKSQLLHPLE